MIIRFCVCGRFGSGGFVLPKPLRSESVGWAKALARPFRVARPIVRRAHALQSIKRTKYAWARRTRDSLCVDAVPTPLPSAPRRRVLPVEKESTSIVAGLIE